MMDKQKIQVLVVDDHAMVRQGMRALLHEYENIEVIGEAANGAKAIELTGRLKPDVILMDLKMPGMDGIEAIKKIRTAHPYQRIIVLTAEPGDDKLIQAVQAGAMGYVVKDAQPDELVQSIQDVYSGEPALSPKITWKVLQGIGGRAAKQETEGLSEREIEVLRLLTLGKTDQQIAKELVLEDVTVRTHISRILSKLGLKNRVHAALYGIRTGLVSLDETDGQDADE
jgi:two-component system, NarL family, response regulator LiaR